MSVKKENLMSSAVDELDFGDIFSNAAEIADFGITQNPYLVDALPIAKITQISPVQTRKPFDPENDPEDKEFLDSIKGEGGNHEPIWVAAIQTDGEEYQLIAGHRRVDALRTVGIEFARALVWPAGTTTEQRDKLTFVENYHRKDLSTAETARALQKLMSTYGYQLKAAAEFLNISIGHAHNLKVIAQGPKEVVSLVEEGLVGASSASKLAQLGHEDLVTAANVIRNGKPVSETLEELAKGVLAPAPPARKKSKQGAESGHTAVLTAGKSDSLLPLLAAGREAELLEALDRTGVAGVFSPEDLRLMALLKLGMEDARWDYVITAYSTLLRADRRCLKAVLSAVQSVIRQKAYSDASRWERYVRVMSGAAKILEGEAAHD